MATSQDPVSAASPDSSSSEAGSCRSQSQLPGKSSQALDSTFNAILTAVENDTTPLSSANVKVALKLKEDGTNYPAWEACYLNACIAKEVAHTVVKPVPCTKANAAATSLLSSSIPEIWVNHVTTLPTAHEAFLWIRAKYRGGFNTAANTTWMRQLQEIRMTREETLDAYVSRVESLYSNLVANNRAIDLEEAVGHLVNGLPAEFDGCKSSLLVTCMAQQFPGVLRTLVQVANSIRFNDQTPRPTPRAAMARSLPNSNSGDGSRGRRPMDLSKVTCWSCGDKGHLRKDCTKWEGNNRAAAASATQHSTPEQCESGTSDWVSLNVFHARCAPSEEWIIDSGASVHVVNDAAWLHNPVVYSSPRTLNLATNDAHGEITAEGDVCLRNVSGQELWLHHVKCVPGASANLLSVSAGVRDGITFVPKDNGSYCAMVGPKEWECRVAEQHGLYVLTGAHPSVVGRAARVDERDGQTSCAENACHDANLWHKRLGHPGSHVIERLDREQLVTGLPADLRKSVGCDTHCETCTLGKQVKPPFPTRSTVPQRRLERVHLDTVGELPIKGLGGEKYFVTIVDDWSGYTTIVPVQAKTLIPHVVKNTLVEWETQTGERVKAIRSDRGTEFLNKELKGHCLEHGIVMETSAPYTPQQNGVAERMNRTIKDKARTMMIGVEARGNVWTDAVTTAAYLHNVLPTKNRDRTPWELFHEAVPDLGHLRVWGCKAYVKLEKFMTTPFSPVSVAGMFVGYEPHSKAYRVRVRGKTVVSRNVRFAERQSGSSVSESASDAQGPYQVPEPEDLNQQPVSDPESDDDSCGAPEATFPEIQPFPLDAPEATEAPEATILTNASEHELEPENFPLHPDFVEFDVDQNPAHTRLNIEKTPQVQPPTPTSPLRRPPLFNFEKGRGRAHGQRFKPLQQLVDSVPPVNLREHRLDLRNARKFERGHHKYPLCASDDESQTQQQCPDPIPAPGEVNEKGSSSVGGDECLDSDVSGSCEREQQVEDIPRAADSGEVAALQASTSDSLALPCEREEPVGSGVQKQCESGKERRLLQRWCESARVVREVMAIEDGAMPSGELPPNLVMLLSSQAKNGSEKIGLGVHFSKVDIPENFREARASEQWEFWEQAMVEEKDSLDSHDCMTYVARPPGQKVIPVHWIYSVKVDSHGNVTRFKARLVAQGCRQIPGVDVNEVFAPTSSFGARRAFLCKAAFEDLEVHQLDIKTAFLNGELEEDVYVTQPPGFDNGDKNTVCYLNKALYGLKQAPRAWHKKLSSVLSEFGFEACKSDAAVFVQREDSGSPIYMLIFVDDLLIASKHLNRVQWTKDKIKDIFAIHDLGEVQDFLGCVITRDRPNRVIFMSNTLKIEKLVDEYGLSGDTRTASVPMSKDFLITAKTLAEDGAGTPLEEGNRYCALIGSLLYIANTTRPDIALAVGVLSRFRCTPTTSHWNEAVKVLRYLKDTKEWRLVLGGSNTHLEGYVDADYGGDLDCRRSTTGFVFKVYGGAVLWGSKKQTATTTSTVEAEFTASSHAIKEAVWLRGLLEELDIPVWRVPLYCDSSGCIQNLKNPLNSRHAKHLAICLHHARQSIALGHVDMKYISSEQNVADVLTKPLVPVLFKRHREGLGVCVLPS